MSKELPAATRSKAPEPEEEALDRARADVGIVAALRLEIDPFVARCDRVKKYTGGDFTFRGGFLRDIRIAFVEGGTGASKARRAAHALIDAHSPQWLISTGFAGGLGEELQVGHIVVANEVAAAEGGLASLRIDLKMKPDPSKGLHVGKLAQASHIIRTTAERKELRERTGAIAVDLESHAIAEVCRDRQVKFLCVRAISDDCTVDLPPEVLSILGRTGSVRTGAVLGALWKRPGSYKDLWRLRQDAHLASERLALFLSSMIKQMVEPRI
jgi:adenosylhomocysteine nucleosidase